MNYKIIIIYIILILSPLLSFSVTIEDSLGSVKKKYVKRKFRPNYNRERPFLRKIIDTTSKRYILKKNGGANKKFQRKIAPKNIIEKTNINNYKYKGELHYVGFRGGGMYSTGLGFHGGLFYVQRIIPRFLMVPELGISYMNTKLNSLNREYYITGTNVYADINFIFKPFKAMTLYVGPSIKYILDFSYKERNESELIEYKHDPYGVGLTFGTGTSIEGFYIDFRYEYILIGKLEINVNHNGPKLLKSKFFENNIKVCFGFFLF